MNVRATPLPLALPLNRSQPIVRAADCTGHGRCSVHITAHFDLRRDTRSSVNLPLHDTSEPPHVARTAANMEAQ